MLNLYLIASSPCHNRHEWIIVPPQFLGQHTMKPEIHPEYKTVTINCSCGNTFETQSTYNGDSISLDVCAKCHPFYTGKQKIVDTAGQVDKFRRRYGNK